MNILGAGLILLVLNRWDTAKYTWSSLVKYFIWGCMQDLSRYTAGFFLPRDRVRVGGYMLFFLFVLLTRDHLTDGTAGELWEAAGRNLCRRLGEEGYCFDGMVPSLQDLLGRIYY